MRKQILTKYPNWINEIDGSKHVAGFTNDMDGLLCASFAKHYLGLEVNEFFDFETRYAINPDEERETIFFDCAVSQGKTFDNHVTKTFYSRLVNKKSANLNNVFEVGYDNYTGKFSMSTLIQLYSIFNIPLPKSEIGKMILLCVDVGFKGFYNARFKSTYVNYLEIMGMAELTDVLKKYTKEEMYQFMLSHQLNASIYRLKNKKLFIHMKDGYKIDWINFDTGMDLDFYTKHLGFKVFLPRGNFELVEEYEKRTMHQLEFTKKYKKMAFSYALINAQTVMASLKKGE